MKITIAEPVTINPLEQFKPIVAVRTRQLLAEMFTEQPPAEPTSPLDKAVLKELKLDVQAQCDTALTQQPALDPAIARPEYNTARVLLAAGAVIHGYTYDIQQEDYDERMFSYVYEFSVQWAKAYLFREKLSMPEEHPELCVLVNQAPYCTCGHVDHLVRVLNRTCSHGLLGHLWETLPAALSKLLPENKDVQRTISMLYGDNSVGGTGNFQDTMLGVVYTEEDTAWFAGFLNLDDFIKLRFRRMRLGAAVKEVTGDDAKARAAADLRVLNGFDIVLHPNDRPFGAEYVRMHGDGVGLSSCMTRRASNYGAPMDVHPCDVYSCAHYGQGDNGLVLVEVQQDGVPVGRGILNVHQKQIVRWYGEYKASIMLRNVFDIEVDTDALDDVQLALIQEGNKIAAPYLDGCQVAYINDAGELVVGNSGYTFTMDDTYGYAYCIETQACCLSDNEYPEDELVWQEETETYYHPDNTDEGILCPIIGEWVPLCNSSEATVDGCDVYISDYIYYGRHSRAQRFGWTDLGGHIGWTEDTDQYYYDDVTCEYYTEDEYNELLAEREPEEEQEQDNAEAA